MAPRGTDAGRVKAQLAKTRATLATAGIPLAWLDAEILVAHVLQSSRERLHSHPDRQLTVAQRVRLRRFARRPAAPPPRSVLRGQREVCADIVQVTATLPVYPPASERAPVVVRD